MRILVGKPTWENTNRGMLIVLTRMLKPILQALLGTLKHGRALRGECRSAISKDEVPRTWLSSAPEWVYRIVERNHFGSNPFLHIWTGRLAIIVG
jgi:hypothetical protein